MNLRGLIGEFRDVPATMLLGTAWVAVFLGMVGYQLAHGQIHAPWDLILSPRWAGGHEFGDMTLAELQRGEVWRVLTATFVHYGLLHLGLNLWMFYQLGAEIESWYGSSLFSALYVLIGGVGNVLSALVRTALHANPQIHSGGGSVVVLGLVALLAVVGWRSRTSFGKYVMSQMVWILIATAVLGLVPFVDNWGHAGGASIGAAVGFAHRLFLRIARRPPARALGALAVLLLAGSAAAQTLEYRRQEELLARYRAATTTRERLAEVGMFYSVAFQRCLFDRVVPKAFLRLTPRPPAPLNSRIPPLFAATDDAFRRALKEQLEQLDALKERLGTGPTADAFSRARRMLRYVLTPKTDEEKIASFRTFQTDFEPLMRRALQEEQAARNEVEAVVSRK
jgi:rhomboid protease GluP